jgi:hypothetical protein
VTFLAAAAVASLAIATAFGHSLLGERMILRPLYAEPRTGLLASRAMRDIIRVIMHLPSMAWVVLGVAVLAARIAGGNPLLSLVAALIFAGGYYPGSSLAGSGIGNLAALRRAHFGGLMLLAAAGLTAVDWALHG